MLDAARKLAGVLLALCAAATFVLCDHAAPPQPGEQGGFVTKAPRAILMEAGSGAVLFQHHADDLAPPASMSKLMTLAVL